MPNIKENWFKIALVLIAGVSAIAVLWMLYQSLVGIPKQRIAREQAQFEYNAVEYKKCEETAVKNYHNGWNNDCKNIELEDWCALPLNLSQKWDELAEADKARCAELYKN